MAKKKAGRRRNGGGQSERVMQLIREGTALQVEMLGAAARVWSEIVDSVANYNRELTNELMRFSGGQTDADTAVNHLVKVGHDHVRELGKLPEDIAKNFGERVRRRAGRPRRGGRAVD